MAKWIIWLRRKIDGKVDNLVRREMDGKGDNLAKKEDGWQSG